MKKALVIILVIAVASIGLWFLLPDSNTKTSPNATQEVSAGAIAQAALDSSKNGTAYIFDVRTTDEFNQKHVDTAINHDVEKMQSGEFPNVAKDSAIYVYCRSGNRSNQAKELMQQNGYTNVTDLGGLTDLQQAGIL